MANIIVSHDIHRDTFQLHIFGQQVGVLDRRSMGELARLINATLHPKPERWETVHNETLYDHRGVAV